MNAICFPRKVGTNILNCEAHESLCPVPSLCLYLFLVYVTMLLVAQDRTCIAANCWFINDRRIGKDVGWSSCGIRLEWTRKTAKNLRQSMPGSRLETGRLTVQVEFFSFLNQLARLNISVPTFRILHSFVCHYIKHWKEIPPEFQNQLRHWVWDTHSFIFYLGSEPVGVWRCLFIVCIAEVENEWSLTAFPPYSFMPCIGTALYLYLDIEADVWTGQSGSSGFLFA